MSNYDKRVQALAYLNMLKEKIGKYIEKFKHNPAFTFVVIGFGLIVIYFIFFSNSKKPKIHPLQEVSVPFEDQNDMIGVKESVDPRDVWTAKIEQRVKDNKEALDLEARNKHIESTTELEKVKQELLMLKNMMDQQKIALERQQIEENVRISSQLSNNNQYVAVKKPKTLGIFNKTYGNKKRNFKDYVPSGAFARAVLTTGIMAGTGSNASSNPEPVRLRLTDAGILSMNLRTEQIKEAILIGDCVGDFSSERAKCRIQTISLENNRGEIIERPVNGWVFGEDGRYGIKGKIIDKSSDLVRLAMLNGLLGGMSNFFQNQATKSTSPISLLTGGQTTPSAAASLKGGLASGAGEAFNKITDFVMDRMNAISPQISVESAREVDVVFQQGFDLNGMDDEEQRVKHPDGNLRGDDYYEDPDKKKNNFTKQANNFAETLQKMNSGIKQEETEDGF